MTVRALLSLYVALGAFTTLLAELRVSHVILLGCLALQLVLFNRIRHAVKRRG